MTKTITLKWYSDPGHAWLKVTRRSAEYLGILPNISAYSYQSKKGNILYLEEDRDAPLFLEALVTKNIWALSFDQRNSLVTKWDEMENVRSGLSPIRKLDPFYHEIYLRIYTNKHDLLEKLKLVDQFIHEKVSRTFKTIRPDNEYPWNLDHYYYALERSEGFIRESGWYSYLDIHKTFIVTNSRAKMSTDNAAISDTFIFEKRN